MQIFSNASGDDVPRFMNAADLVRVSVLLGVPLTDERAAEIIAQCGTADGRLNRNAFMRLLRDRV